MKIGILSDVHANLPALEAALAALREAGAIKILCAGDVVGYGPWPMECIETIERHGIACIRGNHDDWAVGELDARGISRNALTAIEWTRSVLTPDANAWLGKLPHTLQYAGVELVHASHARKPRWPYVLDERRMLTNFLFQTSLLSFHGHTHMPLAATHQRGSRARLVKLRDMELPRTHRCLVNVGSVGQPRDGRPEASCVLFETRDRKLQHLRVPYDIPAVQKRMREVGLPEALVVRLEHGR